MSAVQLAKRLGITQQGVTKLEHSERTRAISLATLSKVAEAMECELEVQFTPKTSLEHTVRNRAMEKARSERNQVVHTMRLEAQDGGVSEVLDVEKSAQLWMTTRIAKLWD